MSRALCFISFFWFASVSAFFFEAAGLFFLALLPLLFSGFSALFVLGFRARGFRLWLGRHPVMRGAGMSVWMPEA